MLDSKHGSETLYHSSEIDLKKWGRSRLVFVQESLDAFTFDKVGWWVTEIQDIPGQPDLETYDLPIKDYQHIVNKISRRAFLGNIWGK